MAITIPFGKLRLLRDGLTAVKKTRVALLLTLLLAVPGLVHAATYYVDNVSGADSNNGTASSTPWRTIAKVNSAALQPGDAVLFKSGGVWREQLRPPAAGTATSPITFDAYGTGSKPVITGADLVTGWTLYSGNIYVAYVGPITAPDQLYVDGKFCDVAHYPNTGYRTATADSTNATTIVDGNLALSASQVVGATVQARTVPWRINSATVSAYDSTSHTLTLSSGINSNAQNMKRGYGYYLQNKLWMLDAPGEWYYDASSGKLYLWTEGSDNPANHTVEVVQRPYAILADKSYVTFNNLAVADADLYNLYIYSSTGVIANNLDVTGGALGVYIIGNSTNCTISNNSIRETLGNGIKLSVNSTQASNTINITGNTINNAGNIGTPKQSDGGIAISTSGVSANVANNVITNNGNNGIILNGDQLVVSNNVIDKSCLVLDDCGGIYTYGMDPNVPAAKTISGNAVSNSVGNYQGTPNSTTAAEGIYLDDGAHDTTVKNNVIFNTDFGIYIHTGHNNTVTGNTVYSARNYGLLLNEAGAAATSPGVVNNNLVNHNTFETVAADATASYNSAIESSTLGFGTFDYNQYCHPNASFVVRNQGVTYTLSAWQNFSGKDLGSTDTQALCTAPAPTLTMSTSTGSSGSEQVNWSSTNATSCTASGPWSGLQPLSGSTAAATVGTYTLTCTGRGGTTTQSATVGTGSTSSTPPPTASSPAPTVSITASPTSVATGGSSTLTWSSTNATSCTPSGAWWGSTLPTSGSYQLSNLTTNGDYTLTCTGSGGSATQTATVTVNTAPTVTITASPTSVATGGSSTLTWSSTNATSCTPSGAWWGSSLPTSGSQLVSNLTTSGNYTLTCTGSGGSASDTATVTVDTAPTVSITASPSSVAYNGSTTLTWSSTNATSCTPSGAWWGSTLPPSGSSVLSNLTTSGNYTLTCTGAGGSTTQTASVTVAPPPPTVSLIASPSTVGYRGSSTLSWSSSQATSCVASGAWSGTKALSGSQSLSKLTRTGTYTLACTGSGGTTTKSATITVNR